MLAKPRNLFGFSALAAAIALLTLAPTAWAGIPDVSVTLDGPSVGWVNQELGYSADGDYELDAETQEEVDEGEATVSESYDWDFGPATCTALPADSSSESCQFDYEDGGEYHTITVTYTVTVPTWTRPKTRTSPKTASTSRSSASRSTPAPTTQPSARAASPRAYTRPP
jgi:hypothetical protein